MIRITNLSIHFIIKQQTLFRKGMRAKRATITHQLQLEQYKMKFDESPLQQRNSNIPQSSNYHSNKQNFFTKKVMSVRFQQAQKEHCCIDIVNRKNLSSLCPTSTSMSKRVSNRDFLKKQVTYLQRDQLKWDKFPKQSQPEQPIQNMTASMTQKSEKQKQFVFHSINKIHCDENSMLLQGFRNTFKGTFYNQKQNNRPITSDQKRIWSYVRNQRKKSMKKYSLIGRQQAVIQQRDKIIHSNGGHKSPFKRYFQSCRAKRNKTYNNSHIEKFTKRSFNNALTIVDAQ